MTANLAQSSNQNAKSTRAALYCRISRDDDTLHDVSVSIETQKHKLADFAAKVISAFSTHIVTKVLQEDLIF